MTNHITIKEMHVNERPLEKCLKHGEDYLSDAELLAILLGEGTRGKNSLQLAEELLYSEESDRGLCRFYNVTKEELMRTKGIGEVKAARILCLAEMSLRMARNKASRNLSFDDAKTVADYYMEDLRHLRQEHLLLIMLDGKLHFISQVYLSKGTVNSALVSPREVFIEALKREAVYIILMHNHPSGDPLPSKFDIDITKRIDLCGKMLGVRLVDHIIIGDKSYISLASEGVLNTDQDI